MVLVASNRPWRRMHLRVCLCVCVCGFCVRIINRSFLNDSLINVSYFFCLFFLFFYDDDECNHTISGALSDRLRRSHHSRLRRIGCGRWCRRPSTRENGIVAANAEDHTRTAT
jgi:hypothetical protein